MKKSLSFLLIPLTAFSLVLSAVAPISTQAQTSTGLCYVFTQNLGEGRTLSAQDAAALTTALSNAGLWNQNTPITTYSDSVASAVSGFQEKYAAQILTPNGLSYGTGFVGPSTRTELNILYGCSTATASPITVQCPAGFTCTPINQNPVTFTCPSGYTCTPKTPTQPVNVSYSSQSSTSVSTPFIASVGSPANPNQSFYPGNQVTIVGSGFPQTPTIYIGSTYVVGQSNASGQNITFTAPQLQAGNYSLYVVGPAEQSNIMQVTVLNTSSGTTCPLGQSWDGPLNVCVGGSNTSGTPAITSLAPQTPGGQATVGTTVIIYGSDFTTSDLVSLSGPAYNVGTIVPTSVSSTQLTFVVPSGVDVGMHTYQVSVTGPGSSSNAVTLSIQACPSGQSWDGPLNVCVGGSNTSGTPAITSLAPQTPGGQATVGTTVIIYGSDFTTSDLVSLSGPAYNVGTIVPTSVSSTQLTFVVPSGVDVGMHTYQVSVTGPGSSSNAVTLSIQACPSGQSWDGPLNVCVGGSNTSGTPAITSLAPQTPGGQATVGTTVIIYGSDFTTSDLVSLSGPAYNVGTIVPTSVSSTQLTFVVPSGVDVGMHTYQVSVTGPGSSSNAVTLSIQACPSGQSWDGPLGVCV